jgi:hypothetical protein
LWGDAVTRSFPDYDTPVKIDMEFELALALLLDVRSATSEVGIPPPLLQSEDIWRLIDNCDGDPERLYAEWDHLTQ